MNSERDILKSELALHGFRHLGEDQWEAMKGDGSVFRIQTGELLSMLTKEIAENKLLYAELWRKSAALLAEDNDRSGFSEVEQKLFIASLKDMARTLELFEDLDNSALCQCFEHFLGRDVASYGRKQILVLPEHKLAMQWVFRQVSKLAYIRKLVLCVHRGDDFSKMVRTANISGPWANLDLPWQERVWSYETDDETFRAKDRSLRRQRRYTKGLENYNNDGRVGEGHYWRELRNEPFSWYDRSTEDPYYTRSVLSRWG